MKNGLDGIILERGRPYHAVAWLKSVPKQPVRPGNERLLINIEKLLIS